mmetsp:Transcript_25853/g.60402  ORF Transcript_25853/g.60402 Transcript_25853/m.60402 type:complete len:520 (+) Transcript_25853:63-1622(+)
MLEPRRMCSRSASAADLAAVPEWKHPLMHESYRKPSPRRYSSVPAATRTRRSFSVSVPAEVSQPLASAWVGWPTPGPPSDKLLLQMRSASAQGHVDWVDWYESPTTAELKLAALRSPRRWSQSQRAVVEIPFSAVTVGKATIPSSPAAYPQVGEPAVRKSRQSHARLYASSDSRRSMPYDRRADMPPWSVAPAWQARQLPMPSRALQPPAHPEATLMRESAASQTGARPSFEQTRETFVPWTPAVQLPEAFVPWHPTGELPAHPTPLMQKEPQAQGVTLTSTAPSLQPEPAAGTAGLQQGAPRLHSVREVPPSTGDELDAAVTAPTGSHPQALSFGSSAEAPFLDRSAAASFIVEPCVRPTHCQASFSSAAAAAAAAAAASAPAAPLLSDSAVRARMAFGSGVSQEQGPKPDEGLQRLQSALHSAQSFSRTSQVETGRLLADLQSAQEALATQSGGSFFTAPLGQTSFTSQFPPNALQAAMQDLEGKLEEMKAQTQLACQLLEGATAQETPSFAAVLVA